MHVSRPAPALSSQTQRDGALLCRGHRPPCLLAFGCPRKFCCPAPIDSSDTSAEIHPAAVQSVGKWSRAAPLYLDADLGQCDFHWSGGVEAQPARTMPEFVDRGPSQKIRCLALGPGTHSVGGSSVAHGLCYAAHRILLIARKPGIVYCCAACSQHSIGFEHPPENVSDLVSASRGYPAARERSLRMQLIAVWAS